MRCALRHPTAQEYLIVGNPYTMSAFDSVAGLFIQTMWLAIVSAQAIGPRGWALPEHPATWPATLAYPPDVTLPQRGSPEG